MTASFLGGLILYAASGVVGLAAARHRRLARIAACALASLGALLEGIASLAVILDARETFIAIPSGLALVQYTFRLDPIACYFNLALAVVTLAISIYSFGYLDGFAPQKPLGVFCFFYALLLISLTVVFTAANALLFLIAWEMMAVAAYFLVSFDHEKTENRRAGLLFLVMSHVGTGALILAFLLLGTWAGGFDFATFHLARHSLTPLRQGTLFLLFFFGFGVKAGMVPVHIWLPAAHPAAPSNVSALMSAIVIKTGIYGIIRVSFDFLETPPLWAGLLVLFAGIASAILGVLYALIEPDLKRMLAYSTIENAGIILMALGATLVFQSYGRPMLAGVALIACLFHIFNHAVFKALLFLSAGAVVHATGTRNMERMGGLIRPMPLTALCFLIGAIAISGLPPLNGFVSEWLAYQALLGGFGSTPSLTRMVFPVAGSLLALTGALAAACFVRAFGIGFLALPRSSQATQAHEVHVSMLAGMGFLAALCAGLGLGANLLLPIFDPLTVALLGVQMSGNLTMAGGIALSSGSPRGGTVAPAALAGLLVLLSLLAGVLLATWWRRGRRVQGPTWDCGLPGLTEYNEYTATAFSKPLRMIFAVLYQPRREILAEFEVSAYYPTSVRFETEVDPAFETHLYSPLKDWIIARANWLRTMQTGSIHAYLAYIFVTLILLLLFGVRS
ncbi:MAG: hydrogenase 4 subunit B [Acidobacteriia bacterium]|nr:hydrogenase 4 subunit B [Terriglobia bacterium]